MFSPIRRSISRKFMLAVMATTLVAVLVSGLGNLAYDVHDYRANAVQDLHAQADLLTQVSLAALEFEDKGSVEDALNQLKSRPTILAAALYRANNTVFASYISSSAASENAVPVAPVTDGDVTNGRDLYIFKSIVRGGEKLGTIYLRSTYPLQERLERGIKTLGAVLILSLLIAAVVSTWLQAAVTKPVKAVTSAVRDLVARRDFSQRVPKTTEDETGVLVDAFNTMLSEIGAHAQLLEKTNF